MEQGKDNFLDKSSLLAIIALGACWLAWDAYMKKKYPNISKPPIVREKETLKEEVLKETKTRITPAVSKERLYKYSGKKMDIVFSSKGLGVKEIKLKEFSDKKGSPIFFKSTEQPLFATQLLQSKETIPFKVKKDRQGYKGVFVTKEIRLVKTITIDEDKFLLKTTLDIKPKKGSLKGVRTVFSQSLPKEDTGNGFVKMLTAYGRDMFKGFVFFEGRKNLFTKEDVEEEQVYPHFSIGALGGKYFGTAFINKSSLLPTMKVKKEERRVKAKVDYTFINKKPITLNYVSFFGPKSLDSLKGLGPEAKKWIDFGFFSWLAHPLLIILKTFYGLVHNWGFAIILLTFFIRLLLLPVNIKSYKSMKIMQTIQPEIKKLRQEHKEDPKKLNLEIMALMKKKKASPFGGCLPLLFQFPVFFALYRVLGESIELYKSPFVLWIQDLSSKDPYFVLPILGGLTLFVQQKITPMNVPPAQARLLTFMPLVFSVFMLNLPSGLTLYIFISSVFGLVQQAFFVKFKQQQ